MKTQCAAKKEDVKIADTVPVITIEPRMKTERRHLKYEFLRDEIEVMSRELARSIQEYKSFEDDLQSVKTDFKAKMDSLTATINKISIWINNGYEFRFIECETVFNTPHDGIIEEFARAFADRLCGPEKPKGWYWDENWLRDENGAPILNNMDGRKLTPLEKAMFANAWRLWLAVSNPKYREANSMIAADIRREAGE